MKIKYYIGRISRARDAEEQTFAVEDLRYHLNRERGYVYLIHMEATPFYKIGRSTNPYRRVKEISNVDLPMNLVLVHTIATNLMSQCENDMHQYFAGKHVKGEWYNLDAADVAYITSFGPAPYFWGELAQAVLETYEFLTAN